MNLLLVIVLVVIIKTHVKFCKSSVFQTTLPCFLRVWGTIANLLTGNETGKLHNLNFKNSIFLFAANVERMCLIKTSKKDAPPPAIHLHPPPTPHPQFNKEHKKAIICRLIIWSDSKIVADGE